MKCNDQIVESVSVGATRHMNGRLVRKSVLQCIAVCCSVSQCVAVRCSVMQCVAVCCSVLQYVAVVAVCCSVLQYVAVCCRHEDSIN